MNYEQSFQQLPTNNPRLPFDVETELNEFSRIFITRVGDPFKIVHCCDPFILDYQVFGELPDKSKKLIFTVSDHYECCKCDSFGCHLFCCSLLCCDALLFQLDYRKNNQGFYTQGINKRKGCYATCDDCNICCCTCFSNLFLKENIDHNNADFDAGIKKGRTTTSLSKFCSDKTTHYFSEENIIGYGIRAECCEIYKRATLRKCCNLSSDFEISIENEKGMKCGNIIVYSGLFSKLVEDRCCYSPKPYFEINMPQNISSFQKFQIIADTIHFDYVNNII